ncbi:cadherin-like and PC-esterase domain-containing protein 1 [Caerostris extrusa]|uniref:Cadherin-like and PC-esterase domain-containing protein 1 n=1 Tax=Caerostris extrusa TaxID=172846 RepID=A0AAV4QG04_CAEEX|nr:cadherin-like and PC-esterase domain-containing protein 1 [Caerostris extrusa]
MGHGQFHVIFFYEESDEARCSHCFQLLGVDVVLNGSLRASVVEVNGQPSVQESGRDEELFINSVKEAVVEDALSLLLSANSVAKQLAKAIARPAHNHNMGILGVNCRGEPRPVSEPPGPLISPSVQKGSSQPGGFRQLYPSVQGDSYGPIIDDIQEYLNEQMKSNGENVSSPYKTAHLHQLVTSLEKLYGPAKSYENYVEEDMKLGGRKSNYSEPIKHWNIGRFSDAKEPFLPSCSDDPTTMPYLSGVSVFPCALADPSFNPLVTDYSANVTYDQLMVSLSAQAHNCQTEVRIDDKYGPTRTTNYTLGVGENRISFLVVDITHTEPWVINTYTLVVHRLTITHGEPPFDPSVPHQVCSLHQECEMRVSPTEMCGIQRDAGISRDWSPTRKRWPACPSASRATHQAAGFCRANRVRRGTPVSGGKLYGIHMAVGTLCFPPTP